MPNETIHEDSCYNCGETVYYGDDAIPCEWLDLQVEHECNGEFLDA